MADAFLFRFPTLLESQWIVQPHLALHIPDGYLSLPVSGACWVFAVALVVLSLRQVQADYQERAVPLMGVSAAFIFAAQMINFPIPGGDVGAPAGRHPGRGTAGAVGRIAGDDCGFYRAGGPVPRWWSHGAGR